MDLTTPIQLYNGRKDNKGKLFSVQEAIDIITGPSLKEHIVTLRSYIKELNSLQDQQGGITDETQLEAIHKLISLKQDQITNHKGQLLAVTWSGTFTTRKAAALLQYSFLICLDIDGVENVKELKEKFAQWRYTFLCFISPSGNGLKVIVKTFHPVRFHKEKFLSLEAEIKEEFNVDIDKSGKDVSRLCFLTYDPRLVHNPKSETYGVEYYKEPVEETPIQETKLSSKQQTDLQATGEDLYSVIHFTDKIQTYSPGNHNKYIHLFACNANRKGFSHSEVESFSIAHFNNKNADEVKATVKSAYQHNTTEHGKFKKHFKTAVHPNSGNENGKQNTPAQTGNRKTTAEYKKQMSQTRETLVSKTHADKPIQFWKERTVTKGKDDNKYEVTVYELKRVEFVDFLYQQGYHLIETAEDNYQICHSMDGIIKPVTPQNIKNKILKWCRDNVDPEIEEMLRKGQKQFFAGNEMDSLHYKHVEMKKDNELESFFYFNNCWVTVTANDIVCKPYSELNEYIWAGNKKDHDFILEPPKLWDEKKELHYKDFNCEFAKFIALASWNPNCPQEKDFEQSIIIERFESLCSAIGFMLDGYKHPADRKAIFAVDHKIGDMNEQNGRTGKSIIPKALAFLKVVALINGKNFDPKYQFRYESITMDSQIINLNDMPNKFDVETIFELIADDYTVNRKNNALLHFNYENSPKPWVSTNFTPKGAGDSYAARMHVIEFSDYFNAKHSPYNEFGHGMLGSAWDKDEWNRFYNFMLWCVTLFKDRGLVAYPNSNFDARKLANEVNSEFIDWMDFRLNNDEPELPTIRNKRLKKIDMLDDFNKLYQHHFGQKLKPHTFFKWIKQYCKHHDLFFNPHKGGQLDKSNGTEYYTISDASDFRPAEVGQVNLFDDKTLLKTANLA